MENVLWLLLVIAIIGIIMLGFKFQKDFYNKLKRDRNLPFSTYLLYSVRLSLVGVLFSVLLLWSSISTVEYTIFITCIMAMGFGCIPFMIRARM